MKQVGDTYYSTVEVRDNTATLVDPESLTLKVRDNTGTVTTYEYETDDIIVHDSAGLFHADVPLTAPGMWVFAWSVDNLPEVEGVQISVSAAPTVGVTFATVAEVRTLFGTLTTDQREQAQMLLEMVTGQIVEEVGRDDDWAATYHPIPRIVRAVCLDVVVRALRAVRAEAAAGGASSESETLGAYSHTVRYGEFNRSSSEASGGGTLSLTEQQKLMCRRAIIGRTSGTSMPGSTLDLALELADTGEIAAYPAE